MTRGDVHARFDGLCGDDDDVTARGQPAQCGIQPNPLGSTETRVDEQERRRALCPVEPHAHATVHVLGAGDTVRDHERRGIARDIESGVNGDAAETIAFWHAWQAEELPFLERDRPWDRADLIVAGTAEVPGADDIAVGRWQHGEA